MSIDILDIIIIVNIILGDFNPNEQEIWASDMNQDNTINIQAWDILGESNVLSLNLNIFNGDNAIYNVCDSIHFR